MNILDAFKLPMLPNFLRYKRCNESLCFPIDQLKDKEIKELFSRMALATIKRKIARKAAPDSGKEGE